MQSVLNGSALAASGFGSGSFFSPLLAEMSNPQAISIVLLCVVVAIPLYFMLASIPLWIAAKIAVREPTTYGKAIGTVISHFVTVLLISIVAAMVMLLAAFAAGRGAALAIQVLFYVVLFIAILMVTANSYGIGIFHAFAVHLLAAVVALVGGALIFCGLAAVEGLPAAHNSLAAIQNFRPVGSLGNPFTSAPSFGNSAPPAPIAAPPATFENADYAAEIDTLLNAAMHPDGPRPSLVERENIVRTLQEKLRAQRSNLPAGDARAALMFQNQLNRYTALLEEVKAERKLHPLRDEVVTEKPAGRDYASPAR